MKVCYFNCTWYQTARTRSRFSSFFLVKNHSCSELNLSSASKCLQNTLALMEENVFRCLSIFEGVFTLSHEIHYPQILLAPNVGRFCLSNKCSSNTRWCDNMSFYLQFGDRNNRSVLFLRFLHCNLHFDIVSVSRFFPNFMLAIILESDLPLIATFLNSH